MHLLPHPALASAAERIRAELAARRRALVAAARRVRHGADAEAVHDLRVAARRLAAALDLWTPFLAPRAARRARRHLRRLRRRLSPVRDLEVLRDGFSARTAEATGETRVALQALLERIERRLAVQTRRARRDVTREAVGRIRRALDRAARRDPHATLAMDAYRLVNERLRVHEARARATLATAFDRRSPDALHEARIQVKRWRYARECWEVLRAPRPDGTGAEMTALGDALRELQQELGRLQDLEVAAAEAGRREARLRRRGRAAEADALASVRDTIASEREGAIAAAQRFATSRIAAAGADRSAGA